MNDYKAIAEAAGTTVKVVREVAKTIYEGINGWYEAGYENTDPFTHGYRTQAEAIKAATKHKQADMAEASKYETGLSLETLAEALSQVNPGGVTVDDLTATYVHDCVAGRKNAASIAAKAMDDHTPVKIDTKDFVIYDYVAGIEGDHTIITERFGAAGIDDFTEVMPWDMSANDRPMLCAPGATLKWTRGTLAHSWYESTEPNDKGEHLTVEVDTIDGGDGSHGWLLSEWAKRGLIKPMASAWNTNVYVRGEDGKTIQAYNPQIAANGEIDFKWIIERTEVNRRALLLEILRRFAKAE